MLGRLNLQETPVSHDPSGHRHSRLLPPRSEDTLVAALVTVLALFVASPAAAQQTIFNVPSADVLAAGAIYVEEDNLWNPGRPEDTDFNLLGVVGLGVRLEGGVNLGGLVARGRSAPSALFAIKWQPYRRGRWALTTGGGVLAYLRGARDGTPSAQVYGHVAWSPSAAVRLTGGGWYATSGFAAAGVTGGALAGLELHLSRFVTAQADWFSGRNALGYFTPGVALGFDHWVLYAAYSFKNGESGGDAVLLELGWSPR